MSYSHVRFQAVGTDKAFPAQLTRLGVYTFRRAALFQVSGHAASGGEPAAALRAAVDVASGAEAERGAAGVANIQP